MSCNQVRSKWGKWVQISCMAPKQPWKFRSGTYINLGTSRNDKVSNFIMSNHTKEHNIKIWASFVDLHRDKGKDEDLGTYNGPKYA